MGMFRRKPKHRDQIRGELVEGIGHLRTATAHAAAGAKEKMGPAMDRTLVAVGLRKKSRRRWPWIAGTVVAVTAAAGTATVIMWRRSNAKAMDEDLFADDTESARADDLAYEPPTMEKEERARTMAGATAD
ncbi:hypothetical protein [Stackebrandtia nassauensis]|uniref:Uncharacterized protein n=1 Tax=Stackebrandtia nassauensis (strain DSM 44728 / CIP 108903 / NRRL B-16338 / NBRC 102104 / LLR-40K-21) TaxID=446470 RepID=D3Q341_STANL|nr:hypothetical protein [Stackebrandtia nassauensis]ADD40011.1 hypothetical protein Snas_0293 [Stackebrandtia nassauensis DSM 44728]